MSLIDSTFFIRELTIAQLGQADGNEVLFDQMLNKYEPLFLRQALGYEFSQLLINNPTEPRFVALLEGSEYTYNDVKYYWQGLVNDDLKTSPIANFVFYWFVRSQFEQQVGIGTMKPLSENATVVAPEYSMIFAWNEMVDYVREMRLFLYVNSQTYPEYSIHQVKCFEKINHYGI